MTEIKKIVAPYLPSLEEEMQAIVQERNPHQQRLFGMLRYHLGWTDAAFEPCEASSGKRVRPVLCLLTCEGCGSDWHQALPAAAAIELIHNFSLIHDDVEDQDKVRRGRPTVWALWGEARAINAGDTLFTLAQLALSRLAELDVPGDTVLAAATLLNETCVALTSGQHLDISFEERNDISVQDYLTMIGEKTAALVACACEMGALIAAAPRAQREQMHTYGRHLGMAFQIRDDILGIWGTTSITGKPVGTDIIRGKKTLPILHGMEQSSELCSLLTQETILKDDVHRATQLLQETKSREYAEELAREHHRQALTTLDEARLQHESAQALHDLAEELLDRRQ